MSSPYLQTRAVQSRGLLVGSVLAGGSMAAVGGSVAVSSLITDYPVFSAQAVRYAAGALLLVGWARLRRLPRMRTTTKERVRLLVIALTGLAGFNVAIVIALRSAEPAAVGVVVGCVPLVLAIVGPILERRAPRARILVAATVVVLGAALVQGVGRTSWAAFGLSLLALAGESAYSLVALPLLPRLGPVGVSIRICAIAALVLAVTAIALDGRSAFETPSWDEAVSVAFLAVVVTAVAFVAWYESIGRLGVERTGLFAGLLPVSALLVGAAVGSESVGALPLAGTLVVGAGITLGLVDPDSRPRKLGLVLRRSANPPPPRA
jgi:drug/metabolite transporter (DMT)-like permease